MHQFQQKPKDVAAEKIECYIIINGLKPHDRLPTERDLCELYGFNRMTLRSALQKLVSDGLIYSKPGAGTFVAERKIARGLSDLNSMTEYAQEQKLDLSTTVISFHESESTKEISKWLKVMLGSKIYILVRLRKFNGVPFTIETVYLSAERFPGLESYNFAENSLYKVFEDQFDVHVDCGEEIISVTYMNDFEADLLEQPEGTPAFFIRLTTCDDIGSTVEYTKSITRADIFYYTNVLNYSDKETGGVIDGKKD